MARPRKVTPQAGGGSRYGRVPVWIGWVSLYIVINKLVNTLALSKRKLLPAEEEPRRRLVG
jgi:hypothetical protein